MLSDGASPWLPTVTQPLDWVEMDGVFVLQRDGNSHAVNPVGALILELSNGRHTLDEITEIVHEAFHLTESPEHEVRRFLERAALVGLVR